jgi:hypothetical protein
VDVMENITIDQRQQLKAGTLNLIWINGW